MSVTGHVELGHHADAAIVRVGDEIADFILRIKQALGTHAGEFGEYFALDAESLVVGKMPVQDVHLDGGHAVEVALQSICWDEVTADVDQRATPREAWLIFDGDGRNRESRRVDLDQLEKCLQAAQNAESRWRGELRSGIGDGQFIRFILAEFLHGLESMVGVYLECGRSIGFGAERNSGLPRKLLFESLDCAVERGIVAASDGYRK